MIVSSASNLATGDESRLTPALVRGLFLIWQSEIQLGRQFAEIREFNTTPSVAQSFIGGAFGVDTDAFGFGPESDRTNGQSHLSNTYGW